MHKLIDLPHLPYKRPSCSPRLSLPTPFLFVFHSPPPSSIHAADSLSSPSNPRRDPRTHRPRARPLTPSRSSRRPHRLALHMQVCAQHPLLPHLAPPLRKNIPRHVRRECTPPQVRQPCPPTPLPRLTTQDMLHRPPAHPSPGYLLTRHRGSSADRLHPLDRKRREEPRAARVGRHLCVRQ